jgi:hypothetical protein
MSTRILVASAIYVLGLVNWAWACDPISTRSVSADAFYDPQSFGTLGIPSKSGYFRVVDRVACFDASDYQYRGILNLRFNNAVSTAGFTNSPTYLAVQVVSAAPYQRVAQVFSLYRNENDKRHPERGFWAHPLGQNKLPDIRPASRYRADELAVANETPFESPEREAANGDYGLFTGSRSASGTHDDFVNNFGRWHALLVTPNELRGSLDEKGQSANREEQAHGGSYTVVQNTWQDRAIWELPSDELNALVANGSIRLRQYLIHYRPFLRQADTRTIPNHEVVIPIQTQGASCIYVRVTGPNSFGTYFSIAPTTSQRFVALRVAPNAKCTAPPSPDTIIASIFSGRAFGIGANAATPNRR